MRRVIFIGMKHFFAAWALLLLTLPALAQTYSIGGKITDKTSGETLPGATVQVVGNGQNTGDGADAEGRYKVANLKAGTYTVTASFVGYKPLTQTVKITTASATAAFGLASDNASLGEVEVVATLAQERATPVAFSAVNEVKLRETLSNRDLPMILNETPGVYATQGGGGTGDSRINVRGFDQRNVAVLVNGVPVNDMENGSVYWSNWDLGDVTKNLQVQRGLSASKIAVPSVGGTINVLTKGFDDKRSVLARIETGSNNYFKSSLMLSSGTLKGDWAVTVYGSRRRQDGWVDQAFDDAWTYFGNVSKRLGKHRLSLTGMGSPQSHGQRTFASLIGVYSNDKARELGAAAQRNGDRGFAYNPNWGYLNRYTLDGAGNRVYQGQEVLNERINYYHKPQINLNDFWQVSNKLFVSTVLYASYGNGGGTASVGSPGTSATDGQINFQSVYDANYSKTPDATGDRLTTSFLRNSVNSHRWYGAVLGADYALTDKVTLSAGVDGRSYYGIHYQSVRDLLGGTYVTGFKNDTGNPMARLRVGDKYNRNYDGRTRWLGGYGQAEYKSPLLSAVVSATVSQISYQRIDYIEGNSTLNTPRTSDWRDIMGYSVKAGANYNLTEHDNVFVNAGYNAKVPFFDFVFDFTTGTPLPKVSTEGISSFEVGYGISYPSLKATLNAYYTYWANKSSNTTSQSTGTLIYNNLRNINARHAGVELSVAQDISRRLTLNSAISLGDWRWIGQGLLNQSNDNNEAVGTPDQPVYLDGVHVGDAAQNQFQLGLRYEPFTGFYVRPSFLLFTKYYASFNPENLRAEEQRSDSYRVPTSRNFDLHLGYDLPGSVFRNKVRVGLKGSILNVLNEFYITDVPVNGTTIPTNPSTLTAFFNRGRTFTVGLSATL